MYVRTYVCMYVRMYVLYIPTYVCMYVRTYVCMYVCMYVHMYICHMCVCFPVVELRLHKPSDDPDALLQQKIPKTYLNLQDEVHKLSLSMEQCNEAPIMNKEQFL